MKLHYRTVFLSDLHLGSNGCRDRDLAKLLKYLKCEKLYLVGDIIDMWRLKSRWHWPQTHNQIVRRILKLANKGTEVVFIPGNHDGAARQYAGMNFGGVALKIKDVHTTADGKRLLVTHGDQYDLVVKHHPVLSALGGVAYEWLVWINRYYNKLRSGVGARYWSLSHYIKLKVKHACTFISRFEETLIKEAKREDLDGVVCGHIHKAEHDLRDGLEYYNCGDWVESCTMVVEHEDGTMEVVDGLELIEHVREAKRLKAREEGEAAGAAGAAGPEAAPEAGPAATGRRASKRRVKPGVSVASPGKPRSWDPLDDDDDDPLESPIDILGPVKRGGDGWPGADRRA